MRNPVGCRQTSRPRLLNGEHKTVNTPCSTRRAPCLVRDGACQLCSDRVSQNVNKFRSCVERGGPAELHPPLLAKLRRLDVEVVEDFKVVRHKSDRTHEHGARVSLSEELQQIGSQPRLTAVARGLEREG